jgi:peptide/nickel transport system substrate-binding protein
MNLESPMTTRSWKLPALLLAGGLALTGCTAVGDDGSGADRDRATGAADEGDPVRGGSLVIGIGSYPQSLNPNLSRSATAFSLHRAMLETLTKADAAKGGELGPGLALSWEQVEPTVWRFDLREGVTWHDGTPFTADDVVATIDLVLHGEPRAQYASRIAPAVGAEKVDERTVDITTSEPSSTLPTGLADIYIHQAAQIAAGGNEALNAEPQGTGQFQLAEQEDGVSVTLTRYDDYWGEPAWLDEVVFRALPEDATRVSALERGEIDVAYNVPPDDGPRLESVEGLDVIWTPIGQTMLVQFPLESPALPQDSPLQNKLVRQALNYAVDKDAIIENLLLGYAEALPGQLIGSDGLGHNSGVEQYPYDPEKAKELLAEAGYPDGFSMTLSTAQSRYIKQLEIPEAVAGQLREVGIDVQVEAREWSALITAAGEKTVPTYYIGWNYFPVMDGDFIVQQFTCKGLYGLMCNEQFDKLFAEQRLETDSEERAAILAEMQEIVHDEAPGIFLFQSPDIFGVRDHVHGFTPTADNMIHLESVYLDGKD